MSKLRCNFCKRPVDKNSAVIGPGRICKKCITAARGGPAPRQRVKPLPLKLHNASPRGLSQEATTYVKPARCHGDYVKTGFGTISYQAGDGGPGWSIPSTIWR
jgi:hypothetical protein